MSLWKIAWRSIQQRGLASALTAMSMALALRQTSGRVVDAARGLQGNHARDGDDLVLSLLGPEREALELDGSVVRLPPG